MTKQVRKHSKQAAKPGFDKRLLWGGLAVALILIVAAGYLLLGQDDSDTTTIAAGDSLPSTISVSQAADLRDAGAFILDVREPDEWDEYHVPGSHLIPLGELASRVSEVPQDQDIVVVCRSGNRSQQGRDILKDAGFTQVTSMSGGLNEWRAANYPVE